MSRKPFIQRLAAAAAAAAVFIPFSASAQYVWIDEKGTKQFSDMPPPASVPSNRILKQPGGTPALKASQEASEEKPSAPARAEPTIAERNADFRKRKAEQAEKEKKAAEEAAHVADKAKNCDRAREYQRTLDSGERIARLDKNGERAYLSDEQRLQESRDNRRVLDDCK
ncbi:MAG TPA: DUF4124 domain-containing protein [Noviherbaspirillum sp.]|nr:DUF4124 domain-containing protein [Noviherbaspirillum sp.]